MLDVRLADPIQPKLLDQLRDVVEAGTHIDRQLLDLSVDHVIQGLYGPCHSELIKYSIFAMSGRARR